MVRDVRYWHSVWCAMCGTGIAYGAPCAVCGRGRESGLERAREGGRECVERERGGKARQGGRWCYGRASTDLPYGATQHPVLTLRMMLHHTQY
eukprot:954048-Rhodomonas_salina.1